MHLLLADWKKLAFIIFIVMRFFPMFTLSLSVPLLFLCLLSSLFLFLSFWFFLYHFFFILLLFLISFSFSLFLPTIEFFFVYISTELRFYLIHYMKGIACWYAIRCHLVKSECEMQLRFIANYENNQSALRMHYRFCGVGLVMRKGGRRGGGHVSSDRRL